MENDSSEELKLHIASLRRYAMALTRNPADADDLVQEALQRAIAFLRDGKRIKTMRSFLFTVLHNVRITHLRRRENQFTHMPIDEIECGLQVEANQLHRAELRALLRAVAALPEGQRQVVLLICLEGLSYREAAAVVGVPIGTVMSRLARARRALLGSVSADQGVPPVIKKVA